MLGRWFIAWLVILSGFSLVACGSRVPDTSVPIEPGGEIGEMTLTTAQDSSDMSQMIQDYCDPDITEEDGPVSNRECDVPAVSALFIGHAIQGISKEELDAHWQTMTWEMFLDGRPVDLAAFGTKDFDWGNQFRLWNVVLEDPTPGDHELEVIIGGEGEPIDVTWTFTVASP